MTDTPEPTPDPPQQSPRGPAAGEATAQDPGSSAAADRPKDASKPTDEAELGRARRIYGDVEVQGAVAQRNIYQGNAITVHGDFIGSSDGPRRELVSSMDVTTTVATALEAFVEPPNFAEVVRLLRAERVVLLTGGGCGNPTAAGAALRALNCATIVELTAGVAAITLVDHVERLCREHPTVGVLIQSVDGDTLRGFTGFDLRRLKEALAGGGALVLTTTIERAAILVRDLQTIGGVAPDAKRVVARYAETRSLSEQARELALAALELLPPPVSPAAAVALVGGAQVRPLDSPQELAASVEWESTALDAWLAEQPTAEHVASLTAAATLAGAPSTDVETAAAALQEVLEGELEPTTEPRRFARPDRGWPAGVVALDRKGFSTHFGRQPAEVVEICRPHRRDRIVTYLWDNLGGGFRGAFLDWLRAMAQHGSGRVRSGAAITAGVLFTHEPIIAERELLRPWALAGGWAAHACGGLALGTPVAFGDDPTPARMLAHAWVTSDNLNFRRVAIAAYGGPLGVWDPAAAAPTRLWQIATETPSLRRTADLSLALLVAAGASAGRARATVISVLSAEAERRPFPRRSYELLPLVFACLAGGDRAARESFAALLDEEQGSLAKLAGLFARAFDAPMGHASARQALAVLLDALAAHRVDRETVNGLIRAMKATARAGRRAALGAQIERALNAEQRDRGPHGDGLRGEAARTLHATFYPIGSRRHA